MRSDRRALLTGGAALIAASCSAGTLKFRGKVAVVGSAPVNTAIPVISGSAFTGSTGTCSQGTWTNSPTSYAYQWKRSGSNIGGATASTYVYQVADEGLNITCTVTATNASGSGSATSAAVVPTPAGSVPVVAPGANWNGTPLSGGTPPTDPTRTTAKPAVHWVVPSNRRLTSAENRIIGVDSDAGGAKSLFTGSISGTTLTQTSLNYGAGIQPGDILLGAAPGTTVVSGTGPWVVSISQTVASSNMVSQGPSGTQYVDFWVEGTVQRVASPQFLTWTENGISKTCYGYFIQLQEADFAAHLTGEARIFASAVPLDPSMQTKVIGYDLVNGGAYDGNYPMSIFPRAAANDRSKTVGPSGANFTTLAAAIADAVSAGAEAPLITFITTGDYEITSAGSSHSGGKGFMTITASGGVTATLGRAATFFADDSGSLNQWMPGWEGIEFRGPGIVFDQRNWTSILVTAAPTWFNGCTFDNSIGTRDTYYWNGVGHGSWGTANLDYFDGCTIKYQTSHEFPGTGLADNRYVMNCNQLDGASSQFSGTHYLYKVYTRNLSTTWIRDTTPAITVSYSGAAATATLSKDVGDYGPNQPSGAGNITLKIAGSADLVIPISSEYDQGVFNYDTLAAALNAVSGVTATVHTGPDGNGGTISRGGMTLRSYNFQTSDSLVHPFTNVDIKTTPFAPLCAIDSHASWWQAFSGNPSHDRSNVIIRDTVTREYGDLGGAWFETGVRNFGETTHLQDMMVIGNVCQMNNPDANGTQFCFSSVQVQHAVFKCNSTNVYAIRDSFSPPNDVIYCQMINNIVGYEVDSTPVDPPTGWDGTVPWNRNFYASNRFGTVNGDPVSSSDNVPYVTYPTAVTPTWKTLMRDPDNGDYRPPASGGSLRGNLFLKQTTYDGTGTAYSASDVAGAWSINAPAPSWPF